MAAVAPPCDVELLIGAQKYPGNTGEIRSVDIVLTSTVRINRYLLGSVFGSVVSVELECAVCALRSQSSPAGLHEWLQCSQMSARAPPNLNSSAPSDQRGARAIDYPGADHAMSVDESSSTKNEEHVPTIRRRFVARANSLRWSEGFNSSLKRVRRDWNGRQKKFPIGTIEDLPDTVPTINNLPVPIRMLTERRSALERDEHLQRVGKSGLREVSENYETFLEWESIVLQVCRSFWPDRRFPNWLGKLGHPCQMFVGICLIWNEREADPERWILKAPRQLHWHGFDPTDYDRHPLLQNEQFENRALKEFIWEKLGRNEVAFNQALEAISEGSNQIRRETSSNPPMSTNGWWYVPIQPGLTVDEWRDLGKLAVDKSKEVFGDDLIGELAAELATQDHLKPPVIAEELGVSEDTITRRLKSAGHHTE